MTAYKYELKRNRHGKFRKRANAVDDTKVDIT
jgi:uncharacterized protein YegP (UPF0339 family)